MRRGSKHTAAARAKMRGPRAPLRTCQEPGCHKTVLARRWCSAHYSRMYRRGTMEIAPQVAWNKGAKTGFAPWRGKKRGPMPAAWREAISAAHRLKPKAPEHAANILAARWRGCLCEYAGVKMRSSYEVRFATLCDAAGVAWRYEPSRFNLGTCSYLPDFYLPTLGMYVEVKGYFSDESQQKVALFRRLHPESPLVVVMEHNLGQFAIGMKPPYDPDGSGGPGDGCPKLEDQLNGLAAQQCAVENGVNCGNPTAVAATGIRSQAG